MSYWTSHVMLDMSFWLNALLKSYRPCVEITPICHIIRIPDSVSHRLDVGLMWATSDQHRADVASYSECWAHIHCLSVHPSVHLLFNLSISDITLSSYVSVCPLAQRENMPPTQHASPGQHRSNISHRWAIFDPMPIDVAWHLGCLFKLYTCASLLVCLFYPRWHVSLAQPMRCRPMTAEVGEDVDPIRQAIWDLIICICQTVFPSLSPLSLFVYNWP